MRLKPSAPVSVRIGHRAFLLHPAIAEQVETLRESGFATAATDIAARNHLGPPVRLPRDLNAQGITTDE